MKCQFRQNSKSGFTLIELLVVMLILVILGIAALPAIRQNMVRARYAADAVPMISDVRTKIELYRYEHDHLPGVVFGTGHKNALKTGFKTEDGCYIQTMLYGEDGADDAAANTLEFSGKPGMVSDVWNGNSDIGGSMADNNGISAMKYYDSKFHIFNQIDVNYEGLRGRFVNPFNLQYIPLFNRGSDYCHVVAVVGNGGGLPMGTGYAVLEYNNTALKVKFLATFERYQPVNGSSRPLNLLGCEVDGATDSGVTKDSNIMIGSFTDTYLTKSFGIETTTEGGNGGDTGDGDTGDGDTGDGDTGDGDTGDESNALQAQLSAMNEFRDALETAGWKID